MSSRHGVSVARLSSPPVHSEAVNPSFTIPDRACTSSPQTSVALNRKRRLEPGIPRPSREGVIHPSKRQKVLNTSFNTDKTTEVKEYMTSQMLQLARISRDVHTAKIHYHRLRVKELEMMKSIVYDELENTQGSLSLTERQIGQIREELYGGEVIVACGNGQGPGWSSLFQDAPSRASCTSDEFSSSCSSDSESCSSGSSDGPPIQVRSCA